MNLVESYLTKNPCYTNNVNKADSRYTNFQKNGPQGLMLHSVGCSQPSATVFVNKWNKADFDDSCVHGVIDANTGDVYQTLPWNYRGWHSGTGTGGSSKSANNTHVGVEMCEPAEITYTGSGATFTIKDKSAAQAAAKRTYEAAVELFAYLCEKYNLDPTADGVIISHAEGYKRGVASNHGDPQHLWTGLGLSYTMDTFRAAVKAAMGTTSTTNSSTTNSDYPDVPFAVQVLVSDLNYRSEPSMSGTVKGQTGKGTFTITKVSGNWGYLKSGAGWIYLANASYVAIGSTIFSTKTYAVGDKVVVNGTIYGNGDGSGGSIVLTDATRYIVSLVSSDTYKYYIGIAAKKGGTRQGWTNPDTLS